MDSRKAYKYGDEMETISNFRSEEIKIKGEESYLDTCSCIPHYGPVVLDRTFRSWSAGMLISL